MRNAVREPFLLFGGCCSAMTGTHYMEDTHAYREGLRGNAEEVGGLADILSSRTTPVYQRYASELGFGEEAFAGLTARTEELGALQRPAQRGVIGLPDVLPNEETATSEAGGGRLLVRGARDAPAMHGLHEDARGLGSQDSARPRWRIASSSSGAVSSRSLEPAVIRHTGCPFRSSPVFSTSPELL